MTGQKVGSAYRERNSTADRALDILMLFSDDQLMISGQEVSDRLGVARSTAYRYLQSLVSAGFLEEQPRVGFRLGTRILELARLARRGFGISEVSLPVMAELTEKVGETVLLTRRYGTSVVCVERTSPDHPLRLSYERGHVLPPNAGAAALALLAWATDAEVEQVIESSGLPRFTSTTITDSAALRDRLAQIRHDGYALSVGELDNDILGIAAPVRGGRGQVVAALSVACLAQRVPEEARPGLAAEVVSAASLISERLELASA